MLQHLFTLIQWKNDFSTSRVMLPNHAEGDKMQTKNEI
jgi:hypothetical protein